MLGRRHANPKDPSFIDKKLQKLKFAISQLFTMELPK